ncbi:TIGR03503 family protein [Photobacterium sanguinicancri]|uniref:TIGR03503 family protein n=1 Tax=Photobacterium sanguinicancri TaxID=875932 RepID=A0ABX4FXY2_9GAMM|nr:TIGR03503 family protein [Photobacterium sanguinicancri]OZS43205.1 TIGR03503 family protein [Photobacterium sanguinicancri]
MPRLLILVIFLPLFSWAQESTQMSWLDNRFRVDPTVDQVSFMVKRDIESNSVVIVRPDGTKYYAWRHPDNVSWYEEKGVDIISIENPMPGPWQAVGRVTPKNKIDVLSNLRLDIDDLPSRLYQSETLKFTARLLQGDKLLTSRDFLDRVKLQVELLEYVENPDSLPEKSRPSPIILGEFADDGIGFDEYPGDGVFTVALPIDIQPGKYRVRVSSRNGIFLRTFEQQVLIYPPPLTADFIQGRDQIEPHQFVITPEMGAVVPGSLAAHIEQIDPEGKSTITQGHATGEQEGLKIIIPNLGEPGQYGWSGWLYATDLLNNRELIFGLPKKHFAIQAELQLDRNLEDFRHQQQLKAQAEEDARLAVEQALARSKAMKVIIGSNIALVILVVAGGFIWRKWKTKKVIAQALDEVESDDEDESVKPA